MSETDFEYSLSIWNSKICTEMGKVQEWKCGVHDPEAPGGKYVDKGSVRLPLILLLTPLEASETSLQKENPAESSSQLFFKPVVPSLLGPWICQNTADSR